ncbi:DUF3343 domain-containing protein [Methanococcus aeolicus]|nr:DUF3343 domain-containing protein [Methanococcus aeolicus]UXM84408.1 DUF3343 domain-containing protein [Methanococcus aeolicus]
MAFKTLKKIISNNIKDKNIKAPKNKNEKKGIIIFSNVKETMKSEQILKKSRFNIKVVAPPMEIREGCDLAIEYDLIDEFGIQNTLEKNKIAPTKYISAENYSQKPLELVKIKKIDNYTMVRCGNMKITIDEKGDIVNVSGGGCPDVPYLTLNLKGKNINNLKIEDNPKNLGYSLCAYTLNKAFVKAQELAR